MAVFKDEDEVYTYPAGIFRRGLETEGLADKMRDRRLGGGCRWVAR